MGLKKFLTYSLVVMLLLITSVTILVNKSLSPLKQAEAETIAIAEEKTSLTEADDFYWYNGNESYFTVTGKNTDSKEIIVIVNQENGETKEFAKNETLSKQELFEKVREREEPARILEARIGIHNDLPIWEVSFRQKDDKLAYIIFSLTTGEWVRTIKNI